MVVLDNEQRALLLARARQAAEHAYIPYSHFPVGAALITADGTVFSGCNIENASYGLTICAERSAVSAAVSAGHREILAVAVSAPRNSLTSPCGACRQVLREFVPAQQDMIVILDDGASGVSVTMGELLPRSFDPEHLERRGAENDVEEAPPHAG
jgi:cytidine deaminase